MARTEDTYRTTIDLDPALTQSLDELLVYAMGKKLLPRSARRTDLIRLLIKEGAEKMQADMASTAPRRDKR